MRSGTLRHKASFIKSTISSYTSLGEPVDAISTYASNVWVSIKQLGGDEIFINDQRRYRSVIEINARYTSGIVPSMKLSYGGNQYNILNVENVEMRNKELKIRAELID
ncbi:MAG: phage head closure protein [Thermodesulfobacteriota bacterium]|nr:phage head closure protein [Thermodesulfobacteriota bacterium]